MEQINNEQTNDKQINNGQTNKEQIGMEHGYKTIIWGLLIATFHLNLSVIPILPAFIGWIIIYNGTDSLISVYKENAFIKARNYSLIIMIITIISQLLTWMGIQNSFTQLIAIIYMIFYLLFLYYLLEGSIQYLRLQGETDYANHYYAIQRAYIILYVINTILMCYAIIFASQGFMMLTAVLGLILVISFMINIKTIKNIKSC